MTRIEIAETGRAAVRAGLMTVPLALALAAAAPGRARAAEPPPAVASGGAGAAPQIRPPGDWFVSAGARVSFLRGAGYDPFSSNDALSQFSATALRSFSATPHVGGAVGLQWEAGTSSASARGSNASLALSRAAVVLEGRYVPRPWAYAFARVAPGWIFGDAKLAEPASPTNGLGGSFSTFALDVSGGLAGRLNPGPQRVGLWLTAEGGYGWAGTHALTVKPTVPAGESDKAGATSLGAITPAGAFCRFAVALDF